MLRIISPLDTLEAVIIGAGASGLSAAKELLAVYPNVRHNEEKGGQTSRRVVVLEESDAVGGMWHKQGEAYRLESSDESEIHSCILSSDNNGDATEIPVATSPQPLYDNLIGNLPKHVMCFRDMPHSHDVPTRPRPHHVQEYFQRYATVHDLIPNIQFQSRVINCSKVNGAGSDDESSYWEITALEGTGGGSKKEMNYRSKRLVVCVGHFRKARVPSCIRGVQYFHGEIMHSSAFRNPGQFDKGSTVLVVGGGISGADIAKILHLHSTEQESQNVNVLVSVREWRTLPHRILLGKLKKARLVRPGISHIDMHGTVHFDTDADGASKDVIHQCNNSPVRPDAIIFATGYRYNYPFLPKDGGFMKRDGFKMERLYMRMLYADDPSLVFLQVPNMVLSALMLIEYQSKWYAQYVQGKLNVTNEIMEAEILSRKDDPTADNLRILFEYIPYCNSLARMTGDYTWWGQMLWVRFPMMITSCWFAIKQTAIELLGKKQKET